MKKRAKKLVLSLETVQRLDQVSGAAEDPDMPSVRGPCGATTSDAVSCFTGTCACWSRAWTGNDNCTVG